MRKHFHLRMYVFLRAVCANSVPAVELYFTGYISMHGHCE